MIRRKRKFAHIEGKWNEVLKEEFSKDYLKKLKKFILDEIEQEKIIYPPLPLIFNAFNLCEFENLKVVILGQDPYPKPNEAHGLSFSVPNEVKKIPRSLNIIYKELEDDLKIPIAQTSDLTKWAQQGVLLLNATLTVEAKKKNSHKDIGWQIFTDKVIKIISEEKNNIIFLLWGSFAHKKADLIDDDRHYILKAPHPAASCYNPSPDVAFIGCKHFSKTNEILDNLGKKVIDWSL